ncbi:MAG: Smr/MutS family protein [Verrucomicrobiota bacterium]|nr:Smr/MutS family protein [Verrucomicrobiota bacterium]
MRTAPPLRTLNIEVGLPTVDEALQRLSIQLSRARTDGVRLVRVIHGWGSASGGGGKIRTAARSWIRQQAQTGSIRFYLFGDHYTPSSPEGRDFLRRHPALRAEERQDRQNPGITFVEPAPIGQARM